MNLDENIDMFLQVAPPLLPPDGRSARKFSVFRVRQNWLTTLLLRFGCTRCAIVSYLTSRSLARNSPSCIAEDVSHR